MQYDNNMPMINEMPQTSGDYMMPPHMEPQYQSMRLPNEQQQNITNSINNMTNYMQQTSYNQVHYVIIDPDCFWGLCLDKVLL